MTNINETLVIVRGGGDIATGVIQKFFRSGFRVLVLETSNPLAIRRTVSLCSAVYQKTYQVEDMIATLVPLTSSIRDLMPVFRDGRIPVMIDPTGESILSLKPQVVIDAILAKRNLGTNRHMAPITIALGPGFIAGKDVDIVVETMRGHSLGKLYFQGEALPNTGIPGELGGKSAERVVHATVPGVVRHRHEIGARVAKGDILFYIDDTPVISPLEGTLRGLIGENLQVNQGLKVADVDPRPAREVDVETISDKARALGGAALEAALYKMNEKVIRSNNHDF